MSTGEMNKITDLVAAELRAERGRKQFTYDAIAEGVDVAQSTIINYLQGKREIPLGTFVKICEVLNVDPAVIITRADEALKNSKR